MAALEDNVTDVRLNIGDTGSSPTLSDAIIGRKLARYPSSDYTNTQAVYLATLECIVLLKAASLSGNSSASRQKVGDVETESASGADSLYDQYCKLYDFWLANPPTDTDTTVTATTIGGLHLLGGVSATANCAIEEDDDLVTAGIRRGWYEDNQSILGDNEDLLGIASNYRS